LVESMFRYEILNETMDVLHVSGNIKLKENNITDSDLSKHL